jgi:subtilisin family serine protease
VAILDTGVDITHPEIQAAQFRIKGYFSQSTDISSEGDLKLVQDDDGHGTHGTSVLLRTAPHAVIYVAKVTKKATDNNGKSNGTQQLDYEQIVEVSPKVFKD